MRAPSTRGGTAGGGPSFASPHPRTYGRPDREGLKRAHLAYVQGHDRGWEAERKQRSADAALEAEARERRLRRARDGEPGAAEGGPPGPAAAAGSGGTAPATARYGVPVPERLDFHRGPDTWRDRLGRAFRGSD